MSDEANDNAPELPLHLAPPKMLGDINIRITLRDDLVAKPTDHDDKPVPVKLPAVAATIASNQIAVVNAKLQRATAQVELSITNGFGRQRSMILSPAELIFLLGAAEKFVQELPQ